jgi:hypothetical protein
VGYVINRFELADLWEARLWATEGDLVMAAAVAEGMAADEWKSKYRPQPGHVNPHDGGLLRFVRISSSAIHSGLWTTDLS